ncbi:rod-binding protein [Insolitispirillum peregrinum]|uniref:Rod binding protein n=1 Tax=Insolitispirillum peregrinum TaxID=80876 RepID=A0A1N7NEW0_9PROT|nr:rod-binding protein [Insolitispirillum peregrinum]SIS96904.1 Rod binding protein [Insolitispirillum peregrinum]
MTSSSALDKGLNVSSVLQNAQTQAGQGQQSSSVGNLLAKKAKTPEQIKEAAQGFEAMFLNQMLKPMFDTIKTDEMFGGGEGEDMWKSMMVDTYAKEITKKGGVGIAEQVMQVMIKAQEAGNE